LYGEIVETVAISSASGMLMLLPLGQSPTHPRMDIQRFADALRKNLTINVISSEEIEMYW